MNYTATGLAGFIGFDAVASGRTFLRYDVPTGVAASGTGVFNAQGQLIALHSSDASAKSKQSLARLIAGANGLIGSILIDGSSGPTEAVQYTPPATTGGQASMQPPPTKPSGQTPPPPPPPSEPGDDMIHDSATLAAKLKAGGLVKVAKGNFTLPESLELTKSVEIVGEGSDLTVINSTASDYLLRAKGAITFKADGVSFVHTDPKRVAHVLRFDPGDGKVTIEIENCRISGAVYSADLKTGGDGITVNGNSQIKITKSVITKNQQWGVDTNGSNLESIQTTVESMQNEFNSNGGGFALAGTGKSSFVKNSFNGNGEGLDIASDNAKLSGNTFLNNTNGLVVTENAKVQLEDSKFSSNKQGIVVSKSAVVELMRNEFNNNSFGFLKSAGTGKISFVKNNFNGNEHALYIVTSDSATLSGNTFSNNKYGLYIQERAKAQLEDSKFSNNENSILVYGISAVYSKNNDFIESKVAVTLADNAVWSSNSSRFKGGVTAIQSTGSATVDSTDDQFSDISSTSIYVKENSQLTLLRGNFKNIGDSCVLIGDVNSNINDEHSIVNIKFSTFMNCLGTAIYLRYGSSKATIDNTVVNETKKTEQDKGFGIRALSNSELTLTNSIISNNALIGITLGSSAYGRLQHNEIKNNSYGVMISHQATGIIQNNEIKNNRLGVTFAVDNINVSSLSFRDNSITNNIIGACFLNDSPVLRAIFQVISTTNSFSSNSRDYFSPLDKCRAYGGV